MKIRIEPPIPITIGKLVWTVVGLSDVGGHFIEAARGTGEVELIRVPESFFSAIEMQVFGFAPGRRARHP